MVQERDPFARKKSNTLVSTIEDQYGIVLNARADTKLRNLLDQRGFESLTQLIRAYHGQLTSHARKRRVFLSFHAEDLRQVSGLRLMIDNPNVALELYDQSVRVAIESEQSSYLKRVIRERISRSEVLVCLIGNGTAWREWVDWELQTGVDLRKGLCGVRLKGSFGRTPPILKEFRAPVAPWETTAIVAVIEQAAARRT
jgi:hypothetical protein